MNLLEAQIYDKVQAYYKRYIEAELERLRSTSDLFEALEQKTSNASRANNYELFCVAYPSLTEHVT